MEKFIFSQHIQVLKTDIMIWNYTLTYKKTVVSGGLNIFPKWADKEQKQFTIQRIIIKSYFS